MTELPDASERTFQTDMLDSLGSPVDAEPCQRPLHGPSRNSCHANAAAGVHAVHQLRAAEGCRLLHLVFH